MVRLDVEEGRGRGAARGVAIGLGLLPPAAALLTGGPVLPVLVASGVLAGLALASGRLEARARPLLLAVVLVGQCIAFTAAFAGHPWQIDTHMLFFAVLAIVATMGSIPALLAGVAVTAVHHLSLGLLLPALVYPSADLVENLLRTLMHAGIVVLEAAILLWSMVLASRAAAEVQARRAELAQSAEEAAKARAEAETQRERAIAAAERTREEGQRAATAVEEISASANAAAEGAAQAQGMVARARHDAEESGQVVQRAMEAMAAIADSSRRIDEIMGVVDEIARQTDLLALNAAVESARAGEAGRGFAVVATEVRRLAQRSADATQQIRGLVTTSSGQVDRGVTLVGETGQALSRIARAVSDLDAVMQGIAAGAAQQSAGLAQVTVAISRIDRISDDDGPQAADSKGWRSPPLRLVTAAR